MFKSAKEQIARRPHQFRRIFTGVIVQDGWIQISRPGFN